MSGDRSTRLRNRLVVSLYLLVMALGVCQALWPHHALLCLGLGLACASTATLACVVDAQIRGRPILTSLHFLIFITWTLAAPIYLVWSRGWRGGRLAVVHAFALGALFVVVYFLPSYLGYRWAYDGYLALQAEDYDRAATLLNRALYLRRQDADTWACLGAALNGKGQVREAAAAYERALALDDSQAGLWYNLGIACADSGDVAAGIKAMEKACVLDAQNDDYRQGLASLRERAP